MVADFGVNTVPVQEVDEPPAQPTRSSAPVAGTRSPCDDLARAGKEFRVK